MQISYLPLRGRNRETRESKALVFPQVSLKPRDSVAERDESSLNLSSQLRATPLCVAYQKHPATGAPGYQATGQASHQLKALVFLPVTHS